jgi:hypothetical protein
MNTITPQINVSIFIKQILTGTFLACFITPLYSADANSLISCSTAVSQVNEELLKGGSKSIKDEKALVSLLQTLNRDDALPNTYITSAKAKQAGWSGADNESLWEASWALNKKSIGGDPIQNAALPKSFRWYSADIESVRGLRSPKRLIYTADDPNRYLTTNTYRSLTKIPACQ